MSVLNTAFLVSIPAPWSRFLNNQSFTMQKYSLSILKMISDDSIQATLFQEDAFSQEVLAELLSREEETLGDSLLSWGKAALKTF